MLLFKIINSVTMGHLKYCNEKKRRKNQKATPRRNPAVKASGVFLGSSMKL